MRIRPQVSSGFLCLLAALSLACTTIERRADGNLPETGKVVDLSYPFDERAAYWPTGKSFQHEKVAFGQTEGGYFYSSFNYAANEHGGTHMDAPIHFAEGKLTVDQIPVERLIGPGVKIDVREAASRDRDYRLGSREIQEWEARHGTIPRGAIVLVNTGWGRHWGDKLKYLGSDKPGDASDLHFPGIAQDAAELLAKQRDVAMVGIDTASLDYGPSKDFIVHRILLGANIPGLENVAALDSLPETGFRVIALPMKIGGGSGGPCRIVALIGEPGAK